MPWDETWEKIFAENEWGKYPGEDLIRFIGRNFYKAEKRSDIKILEVGCGTGANLWYISREGFTVYGIDGSKTAIEKAKKRLDVECVGWNGYLSVGDFSNRLPYQDEYFDAVVDNEAICCNPYQTSKNIYDELSRVLKPQGKLYSRTFAVNSWGDKTGTQIDHNSWIVAEGPMANMGCIRFTNRSDIPDLLSEFNISEVELISRTMNSGQKTVLEWIIIADKNSKF